MTERIVRNVLMYYDEYEANYGDGFYPSPDSIGEEYTGQTTISFEYSEALRSWVQISGDCILGLDGNYGDRLFEKLNDAVYILHPSTQVIYIHSRTGKQLYPKNYITS